MKNLILGTVMAALTATVAISAPTAPLHTQYLAKINTSSAACGWVLLVINKMCHDYSTQTAEVYQDTVKVVTTTSRDTWTLYLDPFARWSQTDTYDFYSSVKDYDVSEETFEELGINYNDPRDGWSDWSAYVLGTADRYTPTVDATRTRTVVVNGIKDFNPTPGNLVEHTRKANPAYDPITFTLSVDGNTTERLSWNQCVAGAEDARFNLRMDQSVDVKEFIMDNKGLNYIFYNVDGGNSQVTCTKVE